MSVEFEFCRGECCRDTRHLGVCSHGHRCAHHVNADSDHRARQTYRNPTQDTALNNVMRSQRTQTKGKP